MCAANLGMAGLARWGFDHYMLVLQSSWPFGIHPLKRRFVAALSGSYQPIPASTHPSPPGHRMGQPNSLTQSN